MKIRQARISDAGEIAEIQVATWKSAYRGIIEDDHLDQLDEGRRADQWRKTIGDPEGELSVLVAEEADETLSGFAAWRRSADPVDGYELLALYVRVTSQRSGRGRALVTAMCSGEEWDSVEWTASVLEANAARAFYESLGAEICEHGEYETGGKVYPTVRYRWSAAELDSSAQ